MKVCCRWTLALSPWCPSRVYALRVREEAGAALPRVGRGLRVVRGPVVREEAVADARVDHDLGVGVGLLEQVAELPGVLRARAGVLLAVQAEERGLDVLHHVEAGHRIRRVRVGAGRRAVPRHRGLDVGVGRRHLVHGGAAPAMAGHADLGRADAGPLLRPVHRGGGIAQDLLAGHRQDDLQDRLDVRDMTHAAFPLEQLGRDRVVAVLGEAARDVLHPLVHPPDLRDDQDDGGVGGVGGPGLVHRHVVAADRYGGVPGDDALRVGLDRLTERLFHPDRVAGEGGGATHLEHLASRETRGFRLRHWLPPCE
jgi:hypothetical protein